MQPTLQVGTCKSSSPMFAASQLSMPAMTSYGSAQSRSFTSSKKMLAGAETMEFKAETRKLLDIVTNSIYTDKEVFMRELISNASDALEKNRYAKLAGEITAAEGGDMIPAEINIYVDEKNNTLTIMDAGIGMTRDELVNNLGTIARSGSKQFVDAQKNNEGKDLEGIIGQFGVGFYSSFMVSETVSVESRSATNTTGPSFHWHSDGSGVFTIDEWNEKPEVLEPEVVEPEKPKLSDKDAELEEQVPDWMKDTEGAKEEADERPSVEIPTLGPHGSKIVMHLKDECKEFCNVNKIKGIIKKYSNFVGFPVNVNGEKVNTVDAIWTLEKTAVSEEQYDEFYRFISNSYDKPKYRLHFRTDAPIDLKVLFFVPNFHSEKFGMGRAEVGVNLYSRKVLIESKPADLLPAWLRFMKGAVDSEDLPLSLSREKPQDTALLTRIRDVLTRKLLRFWNDELRKSPEKYKEFYIEFHMFLKEGLCQDYKYMDQLTKLLLYETSAKSDGEMVTLDDYLSRCPPEQEQIYYLVAPNRTAALKSPYYETFKKHDIEVLLLFNTIDDFCMSNVKTYLGKDLVSAENSEIDLAKIKQAMKDAKDEEAGVKPDGEDGEEGSEEKKKKKKEAEEEALSVGLNDEEGADMCGWLRATLGTKVREVKITKRLSDSPAIITDHESGAMRRMLKMVEQANSGKTNDGNDLPPQCLEINPSHPLVMKLFAVKDSARAAMIAEQLLDNALMSAGLVEDPRYMIPRLTELLLSSLEEKK